MQIKVKNISIIRRKYGTDMISIECEGPPCFPNMPECGCFLRTEVVKGSAEAWLTQMGFDSNHITLIVE